MNIIAVANQKGGVGKTTTVANLAVGLSRINKNIKILVIDLDTQGNCTSLFLKEEADLDRSIVKLFEVKFFKENPDLLIHKTRFNNIKILPSHPSLADKGYIIGNLIKPHERISIFLQGLDYDYVLIDTPPSLGVFSINGMIAADYVLATTLLEKFSITGLEALFATIEAIQEATGKPEVLGTLPVMVDMRLKSHNFYMEKLPATTSLNFLDKYAISVNAPLATATIKGQTVFEYNASAKSKHQYQELANWISKVIPYERKKEL